MNGYSQTCPLNTQKIRKKLACGSQHICSLSTIEDIGKKVECFPWEGPEPQLPNITLAVFQEAPLVL